MNNMLQEKKRPPDNEERTNRFAEAIMSDNERGQSIPVVWNKGVWVPKRTHGGLSWHYFPDWRHPLREPQTIHEMAMMAVLWRS